MKTYSPEFKAKVAIEAIKEHLTTEQVCRKYEIRPTQVDNWKNEILHGAYLVFESENQLISDKNEEFVQQLYAQVGDLKVANTWLNKNLV